MERREIIGDGFCKICNEKGSIIHHIRPIRLGAKSEKSNLVYICKSCNDLLHHTVRTDPNLLPEYLKKNLMTMGYSFRKYISKYGDVYWFCDQT